MPANCTGELQRIDQSVNKSVKDFMRAQFQDWYAAEVFKSYNDSGSEIKSVKLFQEPNETSNTESMLLSSRYMYPIWKKSL